ncbi:MAG TPA: hemolysin III family protein [Gemmatimonadaceae bacterium]|nr:hemolysin III family protein [Gemmatimonadaceae bacterium]
MQTPATLEREEVANALTHGLGLVGSIAALPLLVMTALHRGDELAALGAAIFGISLLILYVTSTVYHALPVGTRKRRWQKLDHAAIYVLIAGTYTPFTLGVLRGPIGTTLLAAVWIAASVGVLVKLVFGVSPRLQRLSTATYLLMGWMAVITFNPLLQRVGWSGLAWLVGGGLAYTLGVIFFECDERIRFGHCVWHVFVLGGSLCHAVAVAGYGVAVPR